MWLPSEGETHGPVREVSFHGESTRTWTNVNRGQGSEEGSMAPASVEGIP